MNCPWHVAKSPQYYNLRGKYQLPHQKETNSSAPAQWALCRAKLAEVGINIVSFLFLMPINTAEDWLKSFLDIPVETERLYWMFKT